MNEDQIIELHKQLRDKYISKTKSCFKYGILTGCGAIALGIAAISYKVYCNSHNSPVNSEIVSLAGPIVTAGAYGFFALIFLGLHNSKKLMGIPREVSKIVNSSGLINKI